MSKSYDVDHEAQMQRAAFRAIRALVNGIFDDPCLLAAGPLKADFRANVLDLVERNIPFPDPDMLDQLESEGFVVGLRDPRLNTDYPGKFMVVEAHDESELPTRYGGEGPWCIVGDDLAELVEEAWEVWADTYGWCES